MMYLSKGELTRSRRTGLDYVSHCGCVYALGPELAGLWKKARLRPQPVPEGKEQAVRRMEGSGLVITTEETGTLAAYRLLTGCVICPNSRKWTDCFLSKPVRRVWKWITEAGLRLTASELIRLEEQRVQPTSALLGEDGRQRLTEMIYFAETIPDGILETLMEHSPARDTVIGALLELLHTWRLLLI